MFYSKCKIIVMLMMILAVTVVSAASCSKTHNTEKYKESSQASSGTDKQADINDYQKSEEITYTIKYYDVIEDSIKEFTETKTFENSVEPEFFIEKLSELINTKIIVNSIKIDGNKMIIDFSSESAPLNGTGSYEETSILDSISDVLLNVFKDIDEIYITADGKDYDSGHTSLTADTPYATRKNENKG